MYHKKSKFKLELIISKPWVVGLEACLVGLEPGVWLELWFFLNEISKPYGNL